MFDPWTSTIEEAIEQEGKHDDASSVRPSVRWVGAYVIGLRKQKVEAGDGYAVMACINDCLTYQLIAPDWLAAAFREKYEAVDSCLVKSWDDPKAFGKPFPKGANISALRKKRRYKDEVWLDIQMLRRANPKLPLDEHLFEEVGKKYGLGKTLTSEYYYEFQRTRFEVQKKQDK